MLPKRVLLEKAQENFEIHHLELEKKQKELDFFNEKVDSLYKNLWTKQLEQRVNLKNLNHLKII
jgi:hypothetical protein